MAKETEQYYVKNPITIVNVKYAVTVVGYDETKGNTAPYVIPRGHVINVPVSGCESALKKWKENNCVEKYEPKRHLDAFLGEGVKSPVELEEVAPVPTSSQANRIMDDIDDLPKVDEPKAAKKGTQATTIGGRKYS